MDGALTFASSTDADAEDDMLSKSDDGTQDDDIYNSDYSFAAATVPTKGEFEKLKKELMDSLDAEATLVDRQIELHSEERDLKVAIENAQVEHTLATLRAQKEKLAAKKK
jgi:hypothetical protein